MLHSISVFLYIWLRKQLEVSHQQHLISYCYSSHGLLSSPIEKSFPSSDQPRFRRFGNAQAYKNFRNGISQRITTTPKHHFSIFKYFLHLSNKQSSSYKTHSRLTLQIRIIGLLTISLFVLKGKSGPGLVIKVLKISCIL